MRQIKVLAILFALLPGIAAAQPATMPAKTVYGRQATPTNGGPGQAIPFAVFFANAGVPAGPLSCSTSNWFNTLSSGGVLGCAQPAITDISGLGTGVPAALAIAPNGAGGFVTSPVPYANFPAGTADHAIGFWGSTVASSLAINNCSGSLTYSTSTHTFGCNNGAGTGTVTSVATAGLASGGPITATGTVTVTAAAKSDQQTGTSTVLAVTPSQQQSHDSANKAGATCTVSGTTVSCTNWNYNISSVTRSSAGLYLINFSTAFSASTAYGCVGNAVGGGGTVFVVNFGIASLTASQISATVTQATAFSAADPASFTFACQGRQ